MNLQNKYLLIDLIEQFDSNLIIETDEQLTKTDSSNSVTDEGIKISANDEKIVFQNQLFLISQFFFEQFSY